MKPRRRRISPTQAIIMGFAAAISVGTVLLALPISHSQPVTFLDAFFTATSAVCVTGLVVVDTGGAFSRFGETVIMLLIKSGGLGILSLGALLALVTGRRLGFRQRMELQAQTSRLGVGGIVRFMRNLLLFTTTIELVGALVLFVRFGAELPAGEALFHSLFHSVSAFNNAGFSLYQDSLARYAADPLVSLTVAALFILGGLGVVVAFELVDRYRDDTRRPFTLHSRVALSMMLILIFVAFVFMLVAEWSNPDTLGPLPVAQKVLAGFFQAVTPRTAGFNSLDFAGMHTGTLVFVMLLMFIGGNPGSTAGGVKTTTAAVLLTAMWSVARGHGRPVLFKRHIDAVLVTKAAVLSTLGVLILGGALTFLSFTEPRLDMLPLLFETVSAFGTVGLSLGATSELSTLGRLIIITLMFLGRVGLVTFALAVAERRAQAAVRYPGEELVVG
ncbi:MAG: TrkH family potassium uptake protein [Trueperaceae bacterium]